MSGKRYAVAISAADLKDKIMAALKKVLSDVEEYQYPFELSEIVSLTETVKKDLSKVEFDTENIMPFDDKAPFLVLPNGFSCLFMKAGGDWESLVAFIIYWDGKKLRGYIPTDGNTWNQKTKKAWGNDDNENPDDAELEPTKLLEDIKQRISLDTETEIEAKPTFELISEPGEHPVFQAKWSTKLNKLHKMLGPLRNDDLPDDMSLQWGQYLHHFQTKSERLHFALGLEIGLEVMNKYS